MSPSSSSSSSSPRALRPQEEIRFQLLLRRTEQHVSQQVATDGRMQPKVRYFVTQLKEMLDELEKHPQSPGPDVLHDYRAKVHFLQKTLEEASLAEAREDADNNAHHHRGHRTIRDREHDQLAKIGLSRLQASAASRRMAPPAPTAPSPLDDLPSAAPSSLPLSVGRTDDPLLQQIHQKSRQRLQLKERNELFGLAESELRRRPAQGTASGPGPASSSSDADLEGLMKAHQAAQEQVAEEMISLTRTLKEQTLAANEIIKKDTLTLEGSSDLADKNTERLNAESERLSEHTKSMCRCWIWFLMLVVTLTFIAMVLVMKLFRKRIHYPVEEASNV